jgi:glycosyltransferase involved in cell wall biosynthesis
MNLTFKSSTAPVSDPVARPAQGHSARCPRQQADTRKVLRILGIRGIPAAHGGFETFVEKLAIFLVARDWRVVVYCQEDGTGPIVNDTWHGIERVRIPVSQSGAKGTVVFDWRAIAHAARFDDLCLTLGYNTAVFCARLRINGIPNLINMDGIEWKRAKWGPIGKTWFWLNERAGCWLGNHLVADHPQIKAHLQTRISASKITMIPYGADTVSAAPTEPIQALGLRPGKFMTVIARAEPENSLLEVVQGFSAKQRGCELAVLGNYEQGNGYHQAVKAAASNEVRFLGAIYDKPVVQALRFHSAAYIHGHQVGGTNPSLVEAMGAGNPIVAHDNRFNRWVAGDGAAYFTCANSVSDRVDELLSSDTQLGDLRLRGQAQFNSGYMWADVLNQYEVLLERYLPGRSISVAAVPTPKAD